MADFTHAERTQFIQEAAIAAPVRPKAPVVHRLPAHKNECSVVGGSVFQFVPGVDEIVKGDVEDSTLFAQLAATKKFKRGTREWYDLYTETMNKLGWTIQGLEFTQFKEASKTASVKEVVFTILKGALAPDAYASCEASINALQAPGNEHALKVFNTESSSGQVAGFQNGLVRQDASGSVGLTIIGYFFNCSKEIKNTLDISTKDEMQEFWFATQTVTLDTDIYTMVRGAIKEKLKKSIMAMVDDIDL